MDTHAALYALGQSRLAKLRQLPSKKQQPLQERLEENGISRREFLVWSATLTAALALPMPFSSMVAEAAELADRVPLIWLHMAECTGCSESLIRSSTPDVSTLIFDHVSLEYQETLMAAAVGKQKKTLMQPCVIITASICWRLKGLCLPLMAARF
ncbi:quinone-reactive Ni/Fe-hydrogenase small chain precursor [Photobacterium aphoticum]|uniref:Quinone-reactive Ni/Fe-hydrogenase small chain n=1 Tax=Photobacterium aphoticum TaxID=754436 RepID=A0A090QVH7_9GAMM|nr:quinone-reactive Ni/Fe-hydrogenase small chain precursor [Photobacterium aphoticum]